MESEPVQNSPDNAPKAVEDIPIEQIRELSKSYSEVLIRLSRRNDRGQVATVYNGIKMPTLDLVTIDTWANAMAGGGRYRCEVKDPMEPSKYVTNPFWFVVEGPPRPPRFLGRPEAPIPMGVTQPQQQQIGDDVTNYYPGVPPFAQPQQQGVQQAFQPPPSPWAQGLAGPNSQGYQPVPYVARTSPHALPPGATMASDELAIRQLGDLKAELAQARSEMRATAERLSAENERLKHELAQKERQVEAERHNAQIAALTAKIEAMSQRPAEPSKNEIKDWAPVLAAVAPVIQAMVTSRASEAQKGLEVQAQVLQSMAQKPSGSELDVLAKLAPVVMPLVTDAMKQRGPEAQAALFQSMAESNLNNVAMMAQLIEAFASASGGGKEEPWWLPMVKNALEGVVQVAAAYTQQPGGLPGQKPLPPRPTGALAGYATVPQQSQPQQPPPPAQQPTKVSVASPPKVPPQLELMFQLLPGDYQTPEWRWILAAIHADPPTPVATVAVKLTAHLEHLLGFDLLPPGLETLREHPRATLEALLEKLPIATTNPPYARELLDRVLGFLAEDGFTAGDDVAEDAGPAEAHVVDASVASDDMGEPHREIEITAVAS